MDSHYDEYIAGKLGTTIRQASRQPVASQLHDNRPERCAGLLDDMTYKARNQFQFAKLVAFQWNDPQWDIPMKVHILNEKAKRVGLRRQPAGLLEWFNQVPVYAKT